MTELDKSIALLENTLNEGFLKDAAKKVGAKIRKFVSDLRLNCETYKKVSSKPKETNKVERVQVGTILGVKVEALKSCIQNDTDMEWFKNTTSKISSDVVKRVNDLKKELLDTMEEENDEYAFTTTREGIEHAMAKPGFIQIDQYQDNVSLYMSFYCPDANAHDTFYDDATLLLYIDYDADTCLYKEYEWQFSW